MFGRIPLVYSRFLTKNKGGSVMALDSWVGVSQPTPTGTQAGEGSTSSPGSAPSASLMAEGVMGALAFLMIVGAVATIGWINKKVEGRK